MSQRRYFYSSKFRLIVSKGDDALGLYFSKLKLHEVKLTYVVKLTYLLKLKRYVN